MGWFYPGISFPMYTHDGDSLLFNVIYLDYSILGEEIMADLYHDHVYIATIVSGIHIRIPTRVLYPGETLLVRGISDDTIDIHIRYDQ